MDYSTLTIAALNALVGGLSKPSKMPGWGYSLPAKDCITGSKLRGQEGSTCSSCYAMRGNYLWPGTQNAMDRRLALISSPNWVGAMSELIRRRGIKQPYFRWHDSGDLQSVEHLRDICKVAENTPDVKHWLPTREYRIVADYRKNGGIIPDNLTVRMSAHMLGGKAPSFAAPLTISTVSRTDDTYPNAHHCPARFQGNSCGDCRACWSPDVAHVDYHAH